MEIKRLLSLDALRGFTIAAMIPVNNPGSRAHSFKPLWHARGNGFVVGVSIALAYTKYIRKGTSMEEMRLKIVFRTLKILGLGLLLNFIHHFRFAEMRYAGMLQRIAVVFLISSLLFLHTRWIVKLISGNMLLLNIYRHIGFRGRRFLSDFEMRVEDG
jgi:predicted acyltransferase